MVMKKFIIIALVLILIGLSGVVVFVVPFGFHTFVHKLVLAEVQELKGKINYEVITRDHHQSTFKVDLVGGQDYKVEIGSLTFINPLENHVKINITNTQNIDQNYEFLLYFQLTSNGKLRFQLKTKDLEIKDEKGRIAAKGVSIFFGDFGDDDVEIIKEKKQDNFVDLIFNKDITITINEYSSDIQGTQVLVKDIELQFSNEENKNELVLKSNMKTGEFNGVLENKPVFSKSSEGNIKLGKFNSDKFKEFFKNLSDTSNPMARNPMFMAMGAMGMLIFPIELTINATGEQKDGTVDFKLNALMKTKNFMDPNNIEAKVYHKNYLQYSEKLIITSLANRYGSLKVKEYVSPDKFKEMEETRKEIEKITIEAIEQNKDDFFKMLVEDKFLLVDGNFHILDLIYKENQVTLGQKQLPLSQFLDLPIAMIDTFFTDLNTNENSLERKFAAAGLVKF